MNVLVIEYEQEMIQKIRDLLSEMDDSIKIVGVTADMLSAADWLTRNRKPDLILANEDAVSAMGKTMRKDIRAMVTFSTNTEKFNFQAFRYNTMRHLIMNRRKTDTQTVALEDYVDEGGKILPASAYKERFLVKQGQRLLSIPVHQIAYFFSHERFIFLRTYDNQKFLLEYRIEQLESLLSPAQFFRVNRSFIVSLPTVKEIHAYFGNRLKLYLSPATEKDVIVSRKRVSDFKEWLDK